MVGVKEAAQGFRKAPALRVVHDEAALLARVVEGDERAFDDLYRIYDPRLRRFLSAMLASPSLVEEVLDDTLLVVWARAGRFDRSSKVSTWIFAIAYRTALAALHRRRESPMDETVDDRPSLEPGPEQQLAAKHVRRAILRAMGELSPDHRAVLDLTYFHELDYREIARIMDCPVETVKSRMHYARRRLRHELPGRLADWL
jgi:RNA polymerase sigma factor (sigma-70 family)